jgi:succinoglycan biosynthesis protein ExoL
MKPIIAYFAHDLCDASVHRRVRMLLDGGAELRLFGYRRSPQAVLEIHGVPAIDLGETWNGRLAARALSILKERFVTKQYAGQLEGVSAIVARNLDVLVLGGHARACAAQGVPLIYECLDIHGSMLGSGPASRVLRGLEAFYLKKCAGLIVSSPGFVREYFEPFQHVRLPWLLVENKYGGAAVPASGPTPQAPWKIGWFGHLRCSRSFRMLQELTEAMGGAVEVIIRGKVRLDESVRFEEAVKESKYISFGGPYRYEDVPALYGEIHYCWAIDYFQEGANSAWLLPNRIYEATANGVVPIALEQVETGRWVKAHGCGVLVQEPVAELTAFFRGLTAQAYAEQRARVAAVPAADVLSNAGDNSALVDFIVRPGFA